MTPEEQIAAKYESEGLDPASKAYVITKDKVVITVIGMQIKAMRTGEYVGKNPVIYGDEIEVTDLDGRQRLVPAYAFVGVKRLIKDRMCQFDSDESHFIEYAKLQWHYQKPYIFMGKIALARALRHGFPELFANDISAEEMEGDFSFITVKTRPINMPGVVIERTFPNEPVVNVDPESFTHTVKSSSIAMKELFGVDV